MVNAVTGAKTIDCVVRQTIIADYNDCCFILISHSTNLNKIKIDFLI